MDEVTEILKNLDWSPLYISLKTGVAATVISFFLGIFAAGKAVKASPGKKAVLDGILTLPMVMPPTVAGFFLLLLFSRRRPVGAFLFEEFGFKVVQTWISCMQAVHSACQRRKFFGKSLYRLPVRELRQEQS